MDGQPLWVLCDYFQRWVPGFPGDSRWVRQSDAEAAVAAECARVRRELLAEIDDLSARVGEAWMVDEVQLRTRLDRIIPIDD